MFLLRRAVNARYLISLHRTDFTPSNWATRVEFTAKLRNPKIYLQCDLNAVYHTCDTCSLHYSVTRCCILSYYWIYYATFRYCIRCTMNFLLRTKKKNHALREHNVWNQTYCCITFERSNSKVILGFMNFERTIDSDLF